MTRIADIMIKELPEQHLLTLRRTINFFEEYSELMGTAVENILALIEENEAQPSSGPIVCFHNIDLEALDVEIGFATPRPLEGKGEVQTQTNPIRKIALTIDRGPYEKQDPTLEELMNWLPAHGYEPAGGIYYHYLNGEDQPEDEYLTEMYMPVR
ncbi:GyrI-like domain-containing protein [Enterococcus hulanensis]|uniref:GyrI-like domain-containing protein n=1 Tax=Enterococcus hulanensis TaxID=2559929 RepID=A0ABU3EV38_9ENTE|nr:GyrI-like domain-containing protein [Enterococcus hulanensis]MDT2598724.1 GyrI-like domain-containing protein [Enterococcus hulanensis]MDT2607772.1 GyrI-like domain-containing protein [Enterococcus hulanensis]MDT2615067.1 GyrI-like domain-containing protein [Enterococcus hulanensis]MDT2626963.1 GyrI-like domain-containing protein [Enterococcus hulanensis]MDT2654137.1 GyrI-like domain-containing protein [Enterococcus hulanensis]